MKGLFHFISKCFQAIWKLLSFTRQLVLNLFFLAFIGVIAFTFLSTDDIQQDQTVEKKALILDLSGPIVEESKFREPLERVTADLLGSQRSQENVLFDIVDTIRYAAKDDNVSGLVLHLKEMNETSLTKLRYIAKAINTFKASGKPVYAIGDYYNQSQYYLASYADKIFMAPDGAVLLRGYGAYTLYYKDLLEKLNVSTHVFRVGTYKSAVEPYLRNDMSDAAKASTSAWLTQLWDAYLGDVSTNRQIDAKTLTMPMDQFIAKLTALNGDLSQMTVELGLVDKLATRQEVRKDLITEFGSNGYDSFKQISYYDYLPQVHPSIIPDAKDIAVVVASGAIMDGTQRQGTVGGDSTAALLRQARDDDNVKAVVLRVDSPGGSAFASEIIRNEVDALQEAGKPVVISMSSVAASGGYWISASADKIIAQPTTITGSIGIFGILTTFEKGLEKMGIHSDGISTSPFNGIGLTRPLDKDVAQVMQLGIEHGYYRFIKLVSDHRDMSLDAVDNVAQGRVWTGKDALEHGLIDQLGDFDDAVQAAAELANMDAYNLFWVKEPLTPMEQFLEELSMSLNVSVKAELFSLAPEALQPAISKVATDINMLNNFNDPKGQYLFCLNCSNL
ncbi:signal peptide peptidase SppA [Aliivibrio salmonicida]|uniref:Protease IV (Endopeptidase IV) n=1 Tax=Aliivibrio salmonicida (strain LFI1238) TaxID=316275 RepID=B6EIH4_ALISL|nr:signal peptide peptidase SppA [Aliivibrio salmonicida]AZL85316.1 signal peptide peptidase SppA [Aliivibrio salmonicida]CAQ79842.1 protease IV (endopeptidase IV) [Aliivibrio salmonicida LFI1238]